MLRRAWQHSSGLVRVACSCGGVSSRDSPFRSAVVSVCVSKSSDSAIRDRKPTERIVESDHAFLKQIEDEKIGIRKVPTTKREYQVIDASDGIPGVQDPTLGIVLPTRETHKMLVDGIPYKQLPIAHIKASSNNTLIVITDARGTTILGKSSGGTVGFKNAAKSSDVAAQTAGYSVGQAVRREGHQNVRVVIRGLGKGRQPSVLGMKMAGLNIVSITDACVDQTAQKPRGKPSK